MCCQDVKRPRLGRNPVVVVSGRKRPALFFRTQTRELDNLRIESQKVISFEIGSPNNIFHDFRNKFRFRIGVEQPEKEPPRVREQSER